MAALLICFPIGKRNSDLETSMEFNEKWYSVKEVAARFGVSCDTIRRLIKRGRLRALKMSLQVSPRRRRTYNVFRIALSELIRFERSWMTS